MIPYMLHSSILLSGCFIFYWLFIRLETFFSLNRWVLISGILLSVLIPLIHIPENWSLRQAATSEIIYTEPINFESLDESKSSNIIDVPETQTRAGEMPVLSKNEKSALAIEKENSLSTAIPIMKILLYIYLIGVVVFFLAFLVQLIILVTKMYTLISFKDGRYRIVELVKDEAPYSFWNSIFINPTKYELEVYTQILNHEKIHIQQAHFIDKLLAEFLLIGFWFNPFVWMLRNAITNNLEYLTDSSMLEMGTEKQAYQLSLLKVSVPQHPLNLSTNYNNSFLKSRIAMMNSKKSSASSSWKYLFLLPLLGFSMVCLNEVQSKEANSYSDTEAYENYLQDSI
ncbi:MAG: beta-lactamase regulating signal transducer with metallopeptidase domain, partial [Saprospiraceae bacterium]